MFIKKHKLEKIAILQNPMMFECGIKDEDLVKLYNCFDVLLHTSYREGFGICMYESMACGVPVIAHDFSAMTEAIVEDDGTKHGWLAKTAAYVETPIGAVSAIPDVYSIAECLEEAYFKIKLRKKYARRSRAFALQYDWNKVINEMWVPYMDSIMEECKPKSLEERKLL